MAMMIAKSKHTVGRMTVTFLMMICLLFIATGEYCITPVVLLHLRVIALYLV